MSKFRGNLDFLQKSFIASLIDIFSKKYTQSAQLAVWPEKNSQMSKNDFTRKIEDFGTYTKIA